MTGIPANHQAPRLMFVADTIRQARDGTRDAVFPLSTFDKNRLIPCRYAIIDAGKMAHPL